MGWSAHASATARPSSASLSRAISNGVLASSALALDSASLRRPIKEAVLASRVAAFDSAFDCAGQHDR